MQIRAANSAQTRVRGHRNSPTGVEEIVDFAGQGAADAGHTLEIGETGAGHRTSRTEMLEKRARARGADACDFVERVGAHSLGPLLPVGADGEAVGFVAQ